MSKVKKVVFFSVFPNSEETVTVDTLELMDITPDLTRAQRIANSFKRTTKELKLTARRASRTLKRTVSGTLNRVTPLHQGSTSSRADGEEDKNDSEDDDDDDDDQGISLDTVTMLFEGLSANGDPGFSNKNDPLFETEEEDSKSIEKIKETTVLRYPEDALTASYSTENVNSDAGSYVEYTPVVDSLVQPDTPGVPEGKIDMQTFLEESRNKKPPESSWEESTIETDIEAGSMEEIEDEIKLGESQSYDNIKEAAQLEAAKAGQSKELSSSTQPSSSKRSDDHLPLKRSREEPTTSTREEEPHSTPKRTKNEQAGPSKTALENPNANDEMEQSVAEKKPMGAQPEEPQPLPEDELPLPKTNSSQIVLQGFDGELQPSIICHFKATSIPSSPNLPLDLIKDSNGGMSVVFHNGYLYIIGAILKRVSTRCCLRRSVIVPSDHEDFQWKKIADLPRRCPFHASLVYRDEIHVTGGRTRNFWLNRKLSTYFIFRTNEPHGSWMWQNLLQKPRQKHCMVDFKGRIMVLGGHGGNKIIDKVLKSVEFVKEFDDEALWEKDPNMRKRRHSFTTAVHGNYIYVVGGHGRDREPVSYVERLKFEGKVWEIVNKISLDSSRRLAFVHQDWIYLIGGRALGLNAADLKSRRRGSRLSIGGASAFRETISDDWEKPEWCLPRLSLSRRAVLIVTLEYSIDS